MSKTVAQIAPSRASVLITGQSGTGKELIAAAIHERSPRAKGPFVKLHCAALAESILESELFGHERGSFTGAQSRRDGRFFQAHNGTLFLDEIGEISPAVQVKLLRFLQEREFERVGGNQTIGVDVRVLAATNRNLQQMVAEGKFREDLYYRLNVITVEMPALRQRPSDVPLLAAFFLRKDAAENGKDVGTFSPAALDLLAGYKWPGAGRVVARANLSREPVPGAGIAGSSAVGLGVSLEHWLQSPWAMKILWAIDFSPRGQNGGQVACELARLTDGSVDVVHVLAPRTSDLLALGADAVVLNEEAARGTESRLAMEARALEERGAKATAWMGQGDIATTLLARAAEIGADVIVMGGKGRTAFGRVLLGSTADRTLRRAAVPVLLVPEGVSTLRSGSGPLRVLAALDGRPAGRAVVRFVRALGAQAACDLTFVRLYWPPEECRRLGLHGPRDFLAPDPEVVADLQRRMVEQVGAWPGDPPHFVVEPTWGEPGARLLDIAHERTAALMVLGAESRHGWGLVTHAAVADHVAHRASDLPILFVPASNEERAAAGLPVLKTILAGTDLTAAGNRAVPFAYALLGERGGVVELCHVHERALAAPPYAYEETRGALTPEARAELEARLRALIPPDAEARGITTRVTVIDGGKAGTVLAQAAERLWADALVIGSRGRGPVIRALLGSDSDETSHPARRPLFIVPERASAGGRS